MKRHVLINNHELTANLVLTIFPLTSPPPVLNISVHIAENSGL